MSRKHIHIHDTRYHALAKYSKAIRASGDFVFLQGQVGTLLDGTLIGPGDPGAQAHQACKNIKRWMEEAGRDRCHGRHRRLSEGVKMIRTFAVPPAANAAAREICL